MRFCSALALSFVTAAAIGADEPPAKFDAKAEIEKLQGVWETGKDAEVAIKLELKGRGLELFTKVKNDSRTVKFLDVDSFAPKEAGKGRIIELTEAAVGATKLPKKFGYQIEKDTLVLSFSEGYLKGEHKLTKVPAKK